MPESVVRTPAFPFTIPVDPITNFLPHRPPFLFVDDIVSETDDSLTARLTARPDFEFFKGHYPGNPIMPGVLISEAVFQAGSVLMTKLMQRRPEMARGNATPVLVRIENARFRSAVRPGDVLTITVKLKDHTGAFTFMAGSVKVGDRRVMSVDFCVAMAAEDGTTG